MLDTSRIIIGDLIFIAIGFVIGSVAGAMAGIWAVIIRNSDLINATDVLVRNAERLSRKVGSDAVLDASIRRTKRVLGIAKEEKKQR
jgi:hypothetical protein